MNGKNLEIIAKFGKRYQSECLYNQRGKQELQEILKEDWYEALKFFFGIAFMRGRRDKISNIFLNRAIKVLDDFNIKENLSSFNQNKTRKDLEKKLQEGGVNNQYDRGLVLSTIEFIINPDVDGHNLINYSLRKIGNGEIEEIYSKLDGLTAVGDKIVSFFLRDLACIFDLNVPNDQQILLQPIDTWVSKILKELEICQNSDDIDKAISGNKKSLRIVREAIIKKCDEVNISSIEFNQGAWYLGSHAFEIILENLDKLRQE